MSKHILELNEKLDKLLSKKQVFVRGIVRGAGIAIGTTIIAAIVLALAGAIFSHIEDKPIIRDIIESTESNN